jgi:condensation enzyme
MIASETARHRREDTSMSAALSLNQEFLCLFDKGDVEGAFGRRHTLVYGWRVAGPLDLGALQAALDDLVVRHEMLRTEIDRDPETRCQRVHPAAPVPLVVRALGRSEPALRGPRAEEFLNEIDAEPFSGGELPHLRAAVGRFEEDDAVLVLTVHHIAGDALSMQVLIRDLAACYTARAAGAEPRLPEVPQHREFAVRQRSQEVADDTEESLAYWRAKLDGARVLAIETDRVRDPQRPNAYRVHRTVIGPDTTAATLGFAKEMRSSAFMVMLAAYKTLLRESTGETDLVVPTFLSGRGRAGLEGFEGSVGPFFNFIPLRTDLAGCGTAREAVLRTRATCLEAYSHDIPFIQIVGQAPGLAEAFADPGRAVVAFEVLQSATGAGDLRDGPLTYAEIRRRTLSQTVCSDIPDGILWALDVLPEGEIAGSLKYDGNLFDEGTIRDLAARFEDVLRTVVTGGA